MSWFQKTLRLPAKSRGSYLVTSHIESSLPEIRQYKIGLLNLFVQHTSCALSLNENWDEDVRADMSDALDKIVPEDTNGEGLYRHSAEGPDDMPAHIKSALIGASVTIPIKDGKLATGTWQGIWYLEFREKRIGASRVHAQWIHYVAIYGALHIDNRDILLQLLDYGEPSEHVDLSSKHTYTFYISPRIGTISPWSSKATSIAHVCGLKNIVKRIERGMLVSVKLDKPLEDGVAHFADLLHDRMTQTFSTEAPNLAAMFADHSPAPAQVIEMHKEGSDPRKALEEANKSLGLALDASEIEYLVNAYAKNGLLARSPFDVELFMFAQVNSEHCRHKQFNASWIIDGIKKPNSLFGMIRSTHKQHPKYVVSAYSDNAAVLEGEKGTFFAPNNSTGEWTQTKEIVQYLAKVETHNHPTAVSPYPGAATGSGGEIRDEGAVGRGSRPKAGLSGFSVSDLLIPGFQQPWELDVGRPGHIASSLDIILEAPIGSAAFNNEFGRPCTMGYFRTLLTKLPIGDGKTELRGYHKPIMIAGGVGTVRPQHALKKPEIVESGSHVIVLGGPAMLIGLGGGAASSVTSGEGSVDLDFASVQRGNAEVQRRAQEVINACVSMGPENPIKFIHDVGAGGLSNALPELVHDAGLGATFELREIDNADMSMSPMQIWCCEAQERYVMAVGEGGLNTFKKIANRERCAYSVVGKATGKREEQQRLVLMDRESGEYPKPIDLPMSVLFGKPPKMSKVVESRKLRLPAFDSSLTTYLPETPTDGLLGEAVNRVLALPSVGSKSFLITIGDRTVGGLTARDQMVGPWQVPVADVSVTATSLTVGMRTGEAMAMGEKPTLALISPAASARMAVAESLMNIAAADLLGGLERIRLSANWMAASGHPGEGAGLYEAVEAIGMELCPQLGISIPVGKDSMSMKMKWTDQKSKEAKEVTAPLSLVISAFAPVAYITKTWTPTLRRYEDVGETILLFVDLAEGHKALGGSALAQVFNQTGNCAPDIHSVQIIKDFFDAISQLQESGVVLAYHDRSDGGLFTTLAEMMFAGRCGLEIMLDALSPSASPSSIMPALFSEELGAVFQVRRSDEMAFTRCFATCGPPSGLIKKIGRVPSSSNQNLSLLHGTTAIFRSPRSTLQQRWSGTSHALQRLRDNPACADAEHANILDDKDPGLRYKLTYQPSASILPLTASLSTRVGLTAKPRVAILREQGVNGHAEMAFAFLTAGFTPVDIHMSDLLTGRLSLSSFVGLAACGGFSYGDVLGAGQGWAKSVLLHKSTRKEFKTFFERKDTFTLGVCNGCQFLSRIKDLIPGAANWPTFARNTSEQYEARVCMVEVLDVPANPSVFLHGMAGSALPIVVAHGEGRASFARATTTLPPSPNLSSADHLLAANEVALRFVDNRFAPTDRYPYNPNGSPAGIAGVRTPDGRVLALMPHPERTVLGGWAVGCRRGGGRSGGVGAVGEGVYECEEVGWVGWGGVKGVIGLDEWG
ncbi:MAG: phosphoribosylformylglycinamidine synthase [Lasallia pustulata]|uniref:Phosphoribosylformylglycinamidine synthase n=1 Tax=Lasallia pustulata TaxID=136370 RepID=A0A5M8PIN0_9LECA|nr:MAG: phosphoribosylformylglycinamidine synthase [Lasallia pustulata]